MKITVKLVIGTTIIIALLFSIGGIYMVDENFEVAYSGMINNNISEHTLKIYSLESSIRYAIENGKEYSEILVETYAKRLAGNSSDNSQMAVYNEDNKKVFSSISDSNCIKKINEFLGDKSDKGASYFLFNTQDCSYMLIASEITIVDNKFKVINMYNVSSVFEEKDRQLSYQMRLNMGVIIAAVICVTLLSMTITANINKLKKSSRRIAQGEYNERTNIRSSDEIGELSSNFDTMAIAIEDHIEKLENDVHSREQFVSDFSHELKTPMTAIMGYSRMLVNDETDKKDVKVAADYIYRECKRLELLSQKLLAMLRISGDQIEYSHIYCDWLSKQIINVVRPYTQNVKIDTKVEEACILGDASLIIDMFRNLIENAVKACNDLSDRKGHVEFTGKIVNDESYEFTVRDNGIGISSENLSRVKEAFFMEDKSRSRANGGSGLGLSICDKICRFHNTSLNIESEPGKGTLISVQFERIQEGGDEHEQI